MRHTRAVAVLIAATTGIAAAPAQGAAGDLAFDSKTYPRTSTNPTEPRVADLNGDNRPEILVAGGTNGKLYTLPNAGDGTFDGAATDTAGCTGSTYNLVTGDWNGDSHTDAVLNCYGQIASFRGTGGGGFQATQLHALTGGTEVLASYGPTLFYTGQIPFMSTRGYPLCTAGFNGSAVNSPGCWYQPDTNTYPSIGGTIAIADIEGDANPEVVSLAGAHTIQLFEHPVWTPSTRASGLTGTSRLGALLLDDIDSDGDTDLVMGDRVNDKYAVLRWQGPGGTAATGWPAATPGTTSETLVQNTTVGAGDFDRDGIRDLVFANYGYVAIHLGNGDGTFGPPQQFTLDGDGFDRYSRLTIADVNGDAKPDIVISVASFGGTNDKVIVMRNTAGGAAPDTTPPETTIGAFSPSGTIPQPTAALYFESSEEGSSYECTLEGPTPSPRGPCTSPKPYTDLANGSYTVTVRATDLAGNTDPTPATRSFTVDVPPPPPPPPPPLVFPGTSVSVDSREPDDSPSSGASVSPPPSSLSVPSGAGSVPTGSASNPPTTGTTQTVTTTTGGRGPKAAASKRKTVVVARGTTKIPVGRTVTLKARLTSAGKKLLKKGKPLRVTVTIVARSTTGTKTTVKKTVKLKPKRRR